MDQITKGFKAIRELGLTKIWCYSLYQLGLRSGHYRRMTPKQRDLYRSEPALPPVAHFPQIPAAQQDLVLAEADQICKGLIRVFGSRPVPLDLAVGTSDRHWSALERSAPDQDIKFIWEPARFGWAITLARAYAYSGNPSYAHTFWELTNRFLENHPPYQGRQWQSAQEVAIRLMVLVFCDRIFAPSPQSMPENRMRLWQAIAEHARRIPPTLVYARAQNNNHLLTEAAGLYTAGLYLADHPNAQTWKQAGWRWLNWCFQNQISEIGTYIQHSVNYHRLMLQVALFIDHLKRVSGEPDWPLATQRRLDTATHWLWALTDPETGRAPNLGANDGAYIFPLTCMPFEDYRPVVGAAAKAFLGEDIYQYPELVEMGAWFELFEKTESEQKQPQAPDMLRVESGQGRAFLHTAQYSDRPSHADQLHIDLWWDGTNVAPDPGTFQYNARPPWDNALTTVRVHNTLTLDDQDPMTPAGRFLWLDWAQAEVLAYEMDDFGDLKRVTGEHNGYRRMGALHQRTLTAIQNGWQVTDDILPYDKPDGKLHTATLTWNLPDWTWKFTTESELHLAGNFLRVHITLDGTDNISLFRAGEGLYGETVSDPTWGWTSPTYGHKSPALMLKACQTGPYPLRLITTWQFETLNEPAIKSVIA